ncbi:MAG: MFS transporter [Pseudonocardia sp.]|nr:MFS transporter [Pseudonocardia sp.]
MGGRFAKLWTASTLSALGTGLTIVAAPLYVSARTSDPLIVAATTGVAMLPWLLFGLPAGVLVDRADRRRLMVMIDWARTAVMGVLAVAIGSGWSSIILLDLVLFLVNTGETVFQSAAQSMVPAVVPRDLLERANGWLVGGLTLTRFLIAGPLGGFLFIVSASIPFFANAGTYAASAILIGLVGGTYRATRPGASTPASPEVAEVGAAGAQDAPAAGRAGVWSEVAEGLRWLLRQRMLRTMALLIGLLNVTLVAASAVLVLLAKQRLHVGSVGYGSLFTCLAVGTLLGALLGGVIAGAFGITAPYWVGFAVAVIVVAATWHVFDRTTVAAAYAEPAVAPT